MQVNWKKIITFLLITFVVSYSWIYIAYALKLDNEKISYLIVLITYMFIPAISAIITQYIYKGKIIAPLQINFKVSYWWLLAWFSPLIIALLAYCVALFIPGIKYSAEMAGMFEAYKNYLPQDKIPEMHKVIANSSSLNILLMMSVGGLFAGLTANAVAAFGEELGWRGFLMSNLAPLGFWKSSLLIGVIWGLWHTPLILHGYNYPQHPKIGVFMMIAFCMFYTPLICYLRLKSKSVIAAAIMHGTINGTYQLSIAFLFGGDDLTKSIMGFPGIALLVVITIAMAIFMRKPDMNELNV